MNQQEWLHSLQSSEEIKKSNLLYEKIESKNVNDEDLHFEYLIVRLFAAMNNFKKLIFSMKLNENFEPMNVVGNKADLIISYKTIELIVEPTLRPKSGKADHFSHISDSKKQIGLLVAQDISKVDLQLWNTYKAYLQNNDKLFMICDVPFLLKLLEEQKDSNKKFLDFIEKSKKIWRSEESWKNIREQIISLIT